MHIYDIVIYLNNLMTSVIINGRDINGTSITATYNTALSKDKARALHTKLYNAMVIDPDGNNAIKINRKYWTITKDFLINTDDEEYLMDLLQGKC
jgi:hypothetical protein